MINLSITSLHHQYRAGTLTPTQLIEQLLHEANVKGADASWIRRLSYHELRPYLQQLEDESPDTLPLYGIPFAIKDNIDLAGVPTTAGCPSYAYTPSTSAFVVERLIEAGAIPLGKTNLDQFATGLVGERSLDIYGAPANPFDSAYIAGGSSSGSAVTTASGQASFALGTDTAGSGRVPASFNNLFGVKPTLGLLSTNGVVPACATLDTISIFALTADDAHRVLDVSACYDPECCWSRRHNFALAGQRYGQAPARFRFGVPSRSQWHTDSAHTLAMDTAIRELQALGGEYVEIDGSAMLEAARLLYEGPWVAERYHAIKELLDKAPDELHPITHRIIAGGRSPLAVDAFAARYRLAELKRQVDAQLEHLEVTIIPTVITHPTKNAVAQNPIDINSRLGRWTNFMNLLDYSALALPICLEGGLPQGVTLFGQKFDDLSLLSLGRSLESSLSLPMGASDIPRSQPALLPQAENGWMELVVCGAHLEGLPLNHELTERQGELILKTRSAPSYRLFALEGKPSRPAMLRDESDGRSIQVEIWRIPIATVGSLLAAIDYPLGLGQVQLTDGRWLTGFIASAGALDDLDDSHDITQYGGWRAWLTAPHA